MKGECRYGAIPTTRNLVEARGALSYSAITARPAVFTMSCQTFLKAREVGIRHLFAWYPPPLGAPPAHLPWIRPFARRSPPPVWGVEGVPRPGYACSRSGGGGQKTAFEDPPSRPRTASPCCKDVRGKVVLQDCTGGGRPAERPRWPAACYRGAFCAHEADAARGLSAIIPLSRTYAEGAGRAGASASQGGA